jgi:hypothetical protein
MTRVFENKVLNRNYGFKRDYKHYEPVKNITGGTYNTQGEINEKTVQNFSRKT